MRLLTRFFEPQLQSLRNENAGPAAQSVLRSVRSTVLTLVASWQVVMVLATFSSLGWAGWPLAVSHAALGAYVVLGIKHPSPLALGTIPLFMAVTALTSFYASGDLESVIVFAACWLLNSSAVAAGLLLLNRWVVPLVFLGAATASIFILGYFPDWGSDLPIAFIVTMSSIVLWCRFGLTELFRLASNADDQTAHAERAAHRAEVRRTVSMQVAEDARILHDTAINTLAVIANGGAGLSDVQQVRDHCARDTEVLQELRSERSEESRADRHFHEIFVWPGLPVRRSGLNDSELARLEDTLDSAVLDGLVGAACEVLTNARKHSHAKFITVDIQVTDEDLSIQIHDDGIGFDETIPTGRGLARSVFGRARDRGFEAMLRTAPGTGTTVTLRAPLESAVSATSEPLLQPLRSPAVVVAQLHRQAGLLWCLGVTALSVISTLTGGPNHLFALYPMLILMGMVCLAGLYFQHRPFVWPVAVFYILATGLTFFLSATATNFGSEGAVHWQSLAASGPFILLLSYRPPLVTQIVGVSVWLTAIGAATVLADSRDAADIVIVGGVVNLLIARGWPGFLRSLAAMTEAAALAQHRAFRDGVRVDAEQAAQETYRRWLDAGLDSALALLSDIAEGRRDPSHADTHEACGEEEAYLRQLVLISPDIVHMGNAAMPLLRHARENRIRFQLRLGGVDTPNEATAKALAGVILHALNATGKGLDVSASVFPTLGGLQLTMAGPHLDAATLPALPANMAVTTQHRGTTGIMQILCRLDGDDGVASDSSQPLS